MIIIIARRLSFLSLQAFCIHLGVFSLTHRKLKDVRVSSQVAIVSQSALEVSLDVARFK